MPARPEDGGTDGLARARREQSLADRLQLSATLHCGLDDGDGHLPGTQSRADRPKTGAESRDPRGASPTIDNYEHGPREEQP